ncbi:MAG TPA: (4Fe-4S)-binding protein [Thermopolyspora sp.]|jgi:Ferredoxin
MKIKADTDVCIGAGMCVLTAPEMFDQSEEDGTVILLTAEPRSDQEDLARRAVQLCPSGALTIE